MGVDVRRRVVAVGRRWERRWAARRAVSAGEVRDAVAAGSVVATVVGPPPDLSALGWDVRRRGARAHVAVVTDPTADLERAGRAGALTVAWTTPAGLSRWIEADALGDADLVVVAGRAHVERVREATGQRAVVPDRSGDEVRASLAERTSARSFVLDVSTPRRVLAARWGDHHVAVGLARALRARGHRARIQTADEWDDPAGRTFDVRVRVKGLGPALRPPGQRHVIWHISHPEELTPEECDGADLVLVASHREAEALRRRTSTPVDVLLQATDHRRFRPRPPAERFAHDVVFVGKTRDVFRSAVRDALAAGLRPAIYGTGWERFVDRSLVEADYVANEDLPRLYSSACVVLNDHWDDMRARGFVSNRIFDALACGAAVVSDDLPDVAELFGGTVATFRDPVELRRHVDRFLADPAARAACGQRGREIVLARHTFDARADELVAAVTRLGP